MRECIKVVAVIFFMVLSYGTIAQEAKYSCGTDEVAFDGNDLIAYFSSKVEKGSKDHSLDYDGLTLYFKTAENRNKFQSDPDKYLPAYNGWCATAVANGSLYKPNYNHYKLQDGKLLFFEVRAFFNGKTAWEKNPELHMALANEKYQKLKVD